MHKPYKSAWLLLMLTACLPSCKRQHEKPLKLGGCIIGLASPIAIKADTTQLRLADYFLCPNPIRSVQVPQNLRVTYDSTRLYLFGKPATKLSNLHIRTAENQYDIPLENALLQTVVGSDRTAAPKADAPKREKPLLHIPQMSLDSIRIDADQKVTFMVYYGNHLLNRNRLQITPKAVAFKLPRVLHPKRTAALRIYAYDQHGSYTVRYLLVRGGKLIVDPNAP